MYTPWNRTTIRQVPGSSPGRGALSSTTPPLKGSFYFKVYNGHTMIAGNYKSLWLA